jgi:hypothetical protein
VCGISIDEATEGIEVERLVVIDGSLVTQTAPVSMRIRLVFRVEWIPLRWTFE